ncbi:ATP-binding protein [Flexivirga meconopsidis]|uniref:ATP-binding protein n=1 Tax=Flexivirga meconopsidis TaxID=2977121 RepID=UPI00223EBCC5|nr:ATP-binding protein [Flexivirga meconopsidis]
MTDPAAWTTTTHDWSVTVDRAHLEAIRARPQTYALGGVRHLILEVLAYADDEARSIGRRGVAVVTTHPDGSISIADGGRGTDTRRDKAGRIIRKPVMSSKDVRFFDDPGRPLLPDGLPRWGMSVVAAVSTVLVHENRRSEGSWAQGYEHGIPAAGLTELPGAGRTGTTVRFVPDLALPDPISPTPADLEGFAWLRVECRPAPQSAR